MSDTNTAPLAGLKVLELARVLAGPWCGQTLADLGADVIKVESIAGDDTRGWGPPYFDYADGERDAGYFHSCNRGKRSISINFADPQGADIVRRLASEADVVVENFKVGGLKKYGLDQASLRALNPRLVYCSITGFGQDGPAAPRPGYDFMIQAIGGIMDLTGEPDGAPQKVGLAFVDIFTGVYSVVAIQAALAHREKTGEGQHIDMSLLDVMTSVLSYHAVNYLVSGAPPKRVGNAHPNIMPYQEFPTADGHLIIAVGNDGQFRKLAGVLDMPELVEDPRFTTNGLRVVNREALASLIAGRTIAFTRDALIAALEEAGVPVGPINDVGQVFAEPQVVHRGLQIALPQDDGTMLPGVRSPILMSGSPLRYEKASPRRAAHTDEILLANGYSADDIARLREAAVVA